MAFSNEFSSGNWKSVTLHTINAEYMRNDRVEGPIPSIQIHQVAIFDVQPYSNDILGCLLTSLILLYLAVYHIPSIYFPP